MRLTKKQQEILSRTAGRRYTVAKLEGRRDPDCPFFEGPLHPNHKLPRSLVSFVKEDKKPYAVWMVHQTVNDTNCDCESFAPAAEVDHNPTFSEIILTGPYGRLTYIETK